MTQVMSSPWKRKKSFPPLAKLIIIRKSVEAYDY
jgi:hypothetical protein